MGALDNVSVGDLKIHWHNKSTFDFGDIISLWSCPTCQINNDKKNNKNPVLRIVKKLQNFA